MVCNSVRMRFALLLLLCTGKRVKVEPLSAVATPQLRQLLSALLLLVQSGSGAASGGSSSKVTAMLEMDRCLKLQSLVVQARHCLAPALRGGNSACQGRYACCWNTATGSTVEVLLLSLCAMQVQSATCRLSCL